MTHRKPLSRYFPSYHSRKGEQTYFVEKVWLSLIDAGQISMSRACELSNETDIGNFDMHTIRKCQLLPKGHTIRAGNKVKAGDFIQLYCWIGKPYGKGSTVINIAPPIEVKRVWDFEIESAVYRIGASKFMAPIEEIALNDGLSKDDLLDWFKYPKDTGPMQIICWNSSIKY